MPKVTKVKELEIYFSPTLRLSRADELNFHLEELTVVTSHANRWQDESKETEKWKFRGYFSDIKLAAPKAAEIMALQGCSEDEINTLKGYMEKLAESQASVIQTVSDFAIQLDDFPREKKKSGRYANKD